jgi:ribosomal protein S21|tara:strand:- start:403 stop:591 length:189 start_codon:yes stop_codon:yes gene_type:complete
VIQVIVKNNNLERALRQLKKEVKESKLLLDLRKKEFYRKPSEINREKRARSRIRTANDLLEH